MSVLEKAQKLQQMMADNNSMDAFEELYHEDVVVIEMPTGEKREGKAAQRAAIQEWFGMVTEFHGGGVGAICSDEENQITTTETWMDITMKEGGRMKMSEVAVQQWKDGQIIEEKFYYHMPGQ
ncbi:MAG: nuclear transport factor 2 family protein [Cyclobacteriaceae bacterium]